MTTTQLELLVQQAVDRSVVHTLTRYIDRAAEEIAVEILKDPTTRVRFATLINAAMDRALTNLNAPPPVELHTP